MANDYHELASEMSQKARDTIRMINSFKEEIEAVDWYYQRCELATDPEAKEIMWHNAVEEMEHAMMCLEWLRRNQDGWDGEMRKYLFTSKPIMELEEGEAEGEDEESEDPKGSLGIGQL